ncbi:hypothetical protein [Methylobacterium oryzihabitans]|uniref:Yip1 domain-containing protein n=1 Tax=Methylobacterium oryzihabitans TaxID=2499852 RepID=A0A3S2VC66_9HYPH|nr:hypothetical protein [Methylobacterium oryzihabitans]RVU19348.1 hypothetical protein EOE48_08070 [Methylobacterium oryzihabitans]
MLVTAEEVGRSLRGAAALLNRHPQALRLFDVSERGFWRSFGAIWLTAPAMVIALALERGPGTPLLRPDHTTLAVLAGTLAAFLVIPVTMLGLARRLGLTRAYVPFVIVTNWTLALALAVLSLPGFLLVLGLATPGLAALYAAAFAVILLHIHGVAVRATLGLPAPAAFLVSLACGLLVAAVAAGAHAAA